MQDSISQPDEESQSEEIETQITLPSNNLQIESKPLSYNEIKKLSENLRKNYSKELFVKLLIINPSKTSAAHKEIRGGLSPHWETFINDCIADVIKLYEKEKYDKTIELCNTFFSYKNVTYEKKFHSRLHYYIGLCHKKNNDLPNARDSFETAKELCHKSDKFNKKIKLELNALNINDKESIQVAPRSKKRKREEEKLSTTSSNSRKSQKRRNDSNPRDVTQSETTILNGIEEDEAIEIQTTDKQLSSINDVEIKNNILPYQKIEELIKKLDDAYSKEFFMKLFEIKSNQCSSSSYNKIRHALIPHWKKFFVSCIEDIKKLFEEQQYDQAIEHCYTLISYKNVKYEKQFHTKLYYHIGLCHKEKNQLSTAIYAVKKAKEYCSKNDLFKNNINQTLEELKLMQTVQIASFTNNSEKETQTSITTETTDINSITSSQPIILVEYEPPEKKTIEAQTDHHLLQESHGLLEEEGEEQTTENNEIDILKIKTQMQTIQINELVEANNLLKQHDDERTNEIAALRQQIETLKTENNKIEILENTIQTQTNEINTLVKANDSLKQNSNEKITEVETIKQEIKALESTTNEINALNQAQAKQISELQTINQNSNQLIREKINEAILIQKNSEALQEWNSDEIKKLDKTIQTKDSEIYKLNIELENLKLFNNFNNEQNDQQTKMIKYFEEENKQLLLDIKAIEEKNVKQATHISELKNQIENNTKKFNQSYQEASNEFIAEKLQLTATIESQKTENVKLKSQYTKLEEKNKQIQNDLQQRSEEYEKHINLLSAEKIQKEKELLDQKSENQFLSENNEEQKKEIEKLINMKSELERKNLALNSLIKKYSSTENLLSVEKSQSYIRRYYAKKEAWKYVFEEEKQVRRNLNEKMDNADNDDSIATIQEKIGLFSNKFSEMRKRLINHHQHTSNEAEADQDLKDAIGIVTEYKKIL